MTGWERVSVRARSCGKCGRALTVGDPVFVYTLPRGPSLAPLRLLRCDAAKCAGPAPPDLPARIARAIGVDGPTPALRPWAVVEAEAVHVREPGEDG